ncbi:hypothetical protein F511_15292 [Dorcoceras hygrometricum]|uniref:Uncharacterized protein n=1 Tax=Dorcoceras hygrometricum TaxID=472368 RepID=A0A2Z7ALI3_9LAMI|nr:hypothetical protein F511_15292 [Dorcoceras hygrometricum]
MRLLDLPNSSADELSPRRGPRERRASGIGECVRIPATNEHLSKDAGDVSGEAPPMLKSAVHESSRLDVSFVLSEENHDPCINVSPPLIRSSTSGQDGGILTSEVTVPDIRRYSLAPDLSIYHPDLSISYFSKFFLCTMSSPSTSRVSSAAESIDSASPVSQAGEPWLPRSEELPNSPWYEEKSSTLRLSDIDIIKEKGGTMGKFEVVIPHPDERAHRPPPGFHTFYMNQIEMGLRFPIPRFIAAFCRHIQLSPSQLAPNSYSFLLALALLLSYHDIPLIPYVLMQLVQKSYASGQCGTGLMRRAGRAGFCVEELREFASAELDFCAELVGLLRRRATRVCQCGTGILCRAGRAFA